MTETTEQIVHRLLSTVGQEAEDRTTSEALRHLLQTNPTEWRKLIDSEGFDVSLLPRMLALPPSFRTPAIAGVMGSIDLLDRFIDLVARLEESDYPEKDRLLHDLQKAARSWDAMTSFLREIYLRMPLPAPVIANDPLLRHLPNGLSIQEADTRHGTTFCRNLPLMTRGIRQCYEWLGPDPAMVMLAAYRNRWVLTAVAHGAFDEDYPVRPDVALHLRQHGIGMGPDLADLLEVFMPSDAFDLRGLVIHLT